MALAETFTYRRTRNLRRAFYRRHWGRLSVLVATVAGVSLGMWLIVPKWVIPMWMLPLFGAALVWAVAQDTVDGTYHLSLGSIGERNTSRVLRKLARSGWQHLDSVMFEHEDVDHVAIGPSGVYVIETKQTDGEFTFEDLPDWTAGWIDQTWRSGRKIRLLLNYVKKVDVPVLPVLVIWGPWVDGESLIIDGVTVVTGRSLDAWLRSSEPRLTPAEVERAADVVLDYKRERERDIASGMSYLSRLRVAYWHLSH